MTLDARSLLRRMVDIPSVSTHEEPLVRFLCEELVTRGWNARRDAAGNLVATRGRGAPHGVLLGHVDTVPGDLPVRDDGHALHGRGSVDAKGPLATFLVAVDSLAEEGALPGTVTVIGCVEEEIASSKGARFAVDRDPPDYCVVGEPSGWDGITLGYKGYLAARLTVRVAKGHGAHDRPTAPELIAAAWQSVLGNVEARDRERTKLFDRVLPELASVDTDDDGRFQTCTARINLRLPPDMDPDAAVAWLERSAGDGSLEVLGAMPAWSGPRTSPLARGLFRSIHEEGGRPRFLHKTGTADLNIVAPSWQCPALAYGPGDAALDHTPEEHIVWEDYERSIRILRRLLTTAPRWLPGSVGTTPSGG